MNFILRSISRYLFMSVVALVFINNLSAMHFLPDWVKPAVEEVSQEFGLKTPKIYEEMRSVRMFNPLVTPTCTDLRLVGNNLIIGDRLIEKLEPKELMLLTRRAFVYSNNWYFSKKLSLVVALLISNAYLLQNRKDAPLQAAGIFLLDAIAYVGFNVYCEKQIDKEIIKNSHDQEILDSAYQKISTNRWPLDRYPSLYKNVARYIGF